MSHKSEETEIFCKNICVAHLPDSQRICHHVTTTRAEVRGGSTEVRHCTHAAPRLRDSIAGLHDLTQMRSSVHLAHS